MTILNRLMLSQTAAHNWKVLCMIENLRDDVFRNMSVDCQTSDTCIMIIRSLSEVCQTSDIILTLV